MLVDNILYVFDIIFGLIGITNSIYLAYQFHQQQLISSHNKNGLVISVLTMLCTICYLMSTIFTLVNDYYFFQKNETINTFSLTTLMMLDYGFYILGRMTMYLLLIFRSYYTFLHSSFQFSKKMYIFTFSLYIIIFIITVVILTSVYLQIFSVYHVSAALYLCFDILFSITICYLYVRRLMFILKQSENNALYKNNNGTISLSPSPTGSSGQQKFAFQLQVAKEVVDTNELTNKKKKNWKTHHQFLI